ncbi:nuclear transport factor 2 family protein [Microbacterium testaceum]|uniref:nuclear transport factor 2 family protein n=1 Tax=Microbacterium testaceum TaxID=2033 RepID=UPI0009BE8A49|nr:nuclear transport factor 2 family protein [Microbacterium testaceum]
MTTRDASGRTVDAAQDALHEAMRRSDTDALQDLLFEGLTFELPDGSVTDREADLNAHSTGAVRFEQLLELHRSTREHAGRARVDSLIDARLIDDGHHVEGKMNYLRYWSIIDGRWQVVAGSVQPVQ